MDKENPPVIVFPVTVPNSKVSTKVMQENHSISVRYGMYLRLSIYRTRHRLSHNYSMEKYLWPLNYSDLEFNEIEKRIIEEVRQEEELLKRFN